MNAHKTTRQFVLTRSERWRYGKLIVTLGLGVVLALTVLANSATQFARLTEFQQRLANSHTDFPRFAGSQAFLERVYTNLTVNVAAGLALLACLIFVAVRFRYHLRAKRWEQQMHLARQVQSELAPADGLKVPEMEAAAEFVPASEVGGDLYDVFSLGAGRTGFALGDVSGKGVPAAMLMGVLHGALRSNPWHQSGAEQEAFAGRLNDLLHARTQDARFATLFFGSYDAVLGRLEYINAGHCPGFVLRAGTSETQPVGLEPLHSTGPVLGLLKLARYEQASVDLNPGDVLVLYSDGLIEATDANGQEFGEARLWDVLWNNRGQGASEVRAAILDALRRFTGGQPADDDMTLLVLEARGAAVPERVPAIASRAIRTRERARARRGGWIK